ncbi:chorismate-binding protein [Cellulomonas palmilytica]|uniref:chorismate-binding protein n=1 Tax=Cellulomonas palmilytica TaxID=2608402 RepID=UPI001F2B066C|nr:chorismate-binding protein [Cellulomonas palmilytica]UJP39111.1 chorismate-binding protein [Cellulomonas palmilytica]
MPETAASARFAGLRLGDLVESVDVREHPERLAEPGWWVLVGEFEGRVRAWRFADARPAPSRADRTWLGPHATGWSSSLGRDAYVAAVETVRAHVREGDVYQANLCRVLTAELGSVDDVPDAAALADVLAAGNPAPYAGYVHVPRGADEDGVWVVTASPELFLRVQDGVVTSAPIKGTATTRDGLTPKDVAENVMITDLVRNDLQRVCEPGTVEVTTLLGVEEHPGLVHLVSTVQGVLTRRHRAVRALWPALLEATFPPGSVSGAPKSSALGIIDALEPVPRGPYCGLVGWSHVAPDGEVRAELAVGIRTFWWEPDDDGRGRLRFGTGAGITWGSDASAEWAETELKAARLVALASRT